MMFCLAMAVLMGYNDVWDGCALFTGLSVVLGYPIDQARFFSQD